MGVKTKFKTATAGLIMIMPLLSGCEDFTTETATSYECRQGEKWVTVNENKMSFDLNFSGSVSMKELAAARIFIDKNKTSYTIDDYKKMAAKYCKDGTWPGLTGPATPSL